ncbi:hypothetical protein [Actinomyces sp.]
MRYTRQLASTALIVAAGLGMGACSTHPGAAVITSSGVTYSNADIKEAAQELFDMKLTKSVDTEYGIRTSLMNSEALAAAGASVGITVTDEQVDALIAQDVAQAGGTVPATMGRATRAIFESETISQLINAQTQVDPTAGKIASAALAEAQKNSGAILNPRFVQPSLGGTNTPEVPLYGDAVAAPKDPDVSSLMGGGTNGPKTQ